MTDLQHGMTSPAVPTMEDVPDNKNGTEIPSSVQNMLNSLTPGWDGPGSVMPNDRCRNIARQIESVISGHSVISKVVPTPVGGISMSWQLCEGNKRVVNIENDEPLISAYTTSKEESRLHKYIEAANISELELV